MKATEEQLNLLARYNQQIDKLVEDRNNIEKQIHKVRVSIAALKQTVDNDHQYLIGKKALVTNEQGHQMPCKVHNLYVNDQLQVIPHFRNINSGKKCDWATYEFIENENA